MLIILVVIVFFTNIPQGCSLRTGCQAGKRRMLILQNHPANEDAAHFRLNWLCRRVIHPRNGRRQIPKVRTKTKKTGQNCWMGDSNIDIHRLICNNDLGCRLAIE